MPEIVDIPVPRTVKEKAAEVTQVIPHERVLERTVEQIKDVPVMEQLTPEIPQRQCLRRAVHVPAHRGA